MDMLILFDAAQVRKLLHYDETFNNFNNGHLVPYLQNIAEDLPTILGQLITEQATLQSICRARIAFIQHCIKLRHMYLATPMYVENWNIQLEIAQKILDDTDPIFSEADTLLLQFAAQTETIEMIMLGATILDITQTEPGLICVNPG